MKKIHDLQTTFDGYALVGRVGGVEHILTSPVYFNASTRILDTKVDSYEVVSYLNEIQEKLVEDFIHYKLQEVWENKPWRTPDMSKELTW